MPAAYSAEGFGQPVDRRQRPRLRLTAPLADRHRPRHMPAVRDLGVPLPERDRPPAARARRDPPVNVLRAPIVEPEAMAFGGHRLIIPAGAASPPASARAAPSPPSAGSPARQRGSPRSPNRRTAPLRTNGPGYPSRTASTRRSATSARSSIRPEDPTRLRSPVLGSGLDRHRHRTGPRTVLDDDDRRRRRPVVDAGDELAHRATPAGTSSVTSGRRAIAAPLHGSSSWPGQSGGSSPAMYSTVHIGAPTASTPR